MKKVLLKKIIMSPEVRFTWKYDEEWNPIDEVVRSWEEIEREIFWLFDVWQISVRDEPIWWKFFDNIDELNKALWTSFKNSDVLAFDKVLEEKSIAWKKVLKRVND